MTTICTTDRAQATYPAGRTCETAKIKPNVGVTLAWLLAVAFAGATISGFVPNPLVGEDALFVTNTAHNLVHLTTAIGFAVVALLGHKASTWFMLAFGTVYALVGVVGFLTLGSASEGHLLGFIHINFLDNFLHVGLGIVISAAGLLAYRNTNHPSQQPQA